MLENSTSAAQPAPAPAPASAAEPAAGVVKRYAPPNQRNRLNRRKSAERFDRTNNSFGADTEKHQVFAPRNAPDYADSGSSNFPNENARHLSRLIALEGCSNSEASQLMNDRWAAAMQCVNDPSIDPAEKPVVHSEKTPAWSPQFRLPHQILSPTGGAAPQMDFLAELRRAKSSAGVTLDA